MRVLAPVASLMVLACNALQGPPLEAQGEVVSGCPQALDTPRQIDGAGEPLACCEFYAATELGVFELPRCVPYDLRNTCWPRCGTPVTVLYLLNEVGLPQYVGYSWQTQP